MSEQIIFLILGLLGGAGALWLFFNFRRPKNDSALPDQVMALQQMVGDQLDRIGRQVDSRLQENVRAVNESKDFLANRVSAAERSVRAVSLSLGKLEQATGALQQTSSEIISFQNMLKNPKVRGSFGEVLLGSLLGEVLPSDRFELQYTFSLSREICDAIIRLQDGYIVAIDAKFPLSNYEAFVHAEDSKQKESFRKVFVRDVKKHISDIATKYIASNEHTLDYAFMYIPIEGVYYETMVRDVEGESLWQYCLAQKVIPVSPNSFLAYLQTVLVGLRGMKIETQAREILQHLGQLRQDFRKFSDEYSTVGSHLNNAKNKYDSSSRQLDKFVNRLEQIENRPTTTIPETTKEKAEVH